MAELLDRRRDGVTVTGVFTPEEAAAAVRRMPRHEMLEHTFGALLGMSLGMVGPEEPDRSRYLDDTDRCRRLYHDMFGFDPHERLASVLQPMAGSTPLVTPTEDGRPYNAGQIRLWVPGPAGLPAHAGNEFRSQLEDGAMRHIVTTTRVTDHLSYFVVVQKPEVGGSLAVYDLTYEDDDGSNQAGWGNGQRVDDAFDDIASIRLEPNPGDLILFGGGWRWHRVDPVGGATERITYGGFCSPSLDGSEIHFWA